jgi:hypothetical protein
VRALAVAFLVLFSPLAGAEFFTGKQLLELLNSKDESVVAVGVGYIAGVFDGTKGSLHCAPDPELKQLVAAVVATLQAQKDPDTLARTADQMFVPFLMARYPCNRAAGPTT